MAYQPKSYKKFVATAATATLVASAIVPVAAANGASTAAFTDVSDKYKDAVEYLVNNNIAVGLTETSFGVDSTIKRGDAAIMLASALELKQDENAAPSGFSDVPARAALAINALKAAGIINGKTSTRFGFDDNLTRGEVALIMANAKAYDLKGDASTLKFTDVGSRYASAVAGFVEAGITAGKTATKFGTFDDIKRGDFAVFVYKAEGSPVATPEVPEVVSVSATNLKTIEVKLSSAIDEDTVTATNVTLKDGTTPVGVTVSLSDDAKTVYVTASGSSKFVQGKEYNLVVDGLKDVAGVAVPQYAAIVKTLDTSVPVAETALLTSPKTVELYFSENVDFPTTPQVLTNILQIDGINAYAQNIDASKLATEGKVVVTLGTALTVGDHKIKVANLKDDAGFPIASKEFTATLVADTTAPSVTSVVASAANKIEVTFSEVVDRNSLASSTMLVKVPGQTDRTAFAPVLVEGNTYEFTLNTPLDLSATVDATLSYKGIKDNYGNTVSDAQSFVFKAGDDTVAPTLTNVKVNTNNTLEVTFSESVLGFNTGDVELYDKDNKKLSNTVAVAAKGTSDKVYTLTITGGTALSGVHSIKILKDTVTDNSIRKNKLSEVTTSVTLNDKVAPNILKAEYVNDVATTVDFNTDNDYLDSKVTIYFDEAMDAGSLTNKANYLIANQPLADVTGNVTLTPSADNKSVTITINRSSSDGVGQLAFVNGTTSNVRVIAVKDASGITLDSSDVNTPLTLSGFVAAPAFTTAVGSAKAVAKNQIKLTSANGYLFSGINPNEIKFAENQQGGKLIPGLQVQSYTIAADGKTAVLTLNNNISADAKYDGEDALEVAESVSIFAGASAITLTNGSKTAAEAVTGGFDVEDFISPTLVVTDTDKDGKVDVNDTNNSLTLTFDEVVAGSETALESALVIKDVDGTRLSTSDYSIAAINSTDVVITFAADATEDYVGNFTVSLTDNVLLTDATVNANLAKDFSVTTEDFTVESTATVNDGTANTNLATAKQAATTKEAEANYATTYTVASRQAVDDAQALPEGTTAEKNTKTTAINNAVAALVTVVDANLATAKQAATTKEAEANYATTYTVASRQAVDDAQALPETTDAEKIAKTTALNDAVTGLATV